MKAFKRMFSSKEVKAILGVLDEADQRLNFDVFRIVKNDCIELVFAHPDKFTDMMKNGLSARHIAYSLILNTTGNLLESGKYHIYRGVLNHLTGGEHLLRIFDTAVNEMVEIGSVSLEDAAEDKRALRKGIKAVG